MTDEAQEREAREIERAFEDVIATPSGKRVLYWILEQAAIYRDAFAGDDAATNYTLGRQATGRKVMEMLDHLDPRHYPRLLLEIADLKAMDRAAGGRDEQEEDQDEAP